MSKLIAINYQREIPPFMLTEMRYAAQNFDEVFYVTRELVNNNSNLLIGDNIHVIEIDKKMRLRSILKLPFLILRREVIQELVHGIKKQYLPKGHFEHLLKELYCAENVFQAAEPLIRNNVKNEKIVVQATWFNECAIATAWLKKRYQEITAVSLAHSFEINPKVSRYVGSSLDGYKLHMLDRVYFISYTMKEIYESFIKSRVFVDENKMKVRYLGSTRLYSKKDVEKKNEEFVICSCSGVVPVKRIDMLIESLSQWKGNKIRWVHLGGGPLLEEMKELAKSRLDPLLNVQYEFIGQLKNEDVQKYYHTHYIDLFINVSESEGLPVSIMEAMSYGIPVIATNVGGTREIVNQGAEYLIDKNFACKELLQKIQMVYDYTPEERKALSSKVLETWESKFNAAVSAMKYYKNIGESVER